MNNTQIQLFKNLLCCPKCKENLEITEKKLSCISCKKSFPIMQEIPVFSKDVSQSQLVSQQKIFNSEYSQIANYTLHNWQQSFLNRLWESFQFKKTINKENKKEIYIDIGAGGSAYTVIETAKKGITSVGCDLSFTGMLKAKNFAKEQGVAQRCLFVVCDAENLPFKNNSFEYLSCIMLLEHLSNDKQAIAEISRVAKEKAKIFISVPNTYLRMWPFLWPLYMLWDKKLGHVRHYSEATLVDLFRKNKLKRVSVFYTVHLVKFVQMILDKIVPQQWKNTLWWKLEKIDFMQIKIKTGLNLNAVFKK